MIAAIDDGWDDGPDGTGVQVQVQVQVQEMQDGGWV